MLRFNSILFFLVTASVGVYLILQFPALASSRIFLVNIHHKIRKPSREHAAKPFTRQPFVRHIVAVGDLHGDLSNALKVLRFAGVTDNNDNFAMSRGSVFVQTGDIIDRGDDTIGLFALMDKLRGQAHAQGSIMLTVLGNHEWMNAIGIGDWRYVYPSEIATFGSVADRQKELATGPIGRSWAMNYTTAARLPLHPSIGAPNEPYPHEDDILHFQQDLGDPVEEERQQQLQLKARLGPLSHAAVSFVHGGLAPTYPDLTPFPSRINELGTSLLAKLQHRRQPPVHPPNEYPGLPHGTTVDEERLQSADGPLWYRGWALQSEEDMCSDVDMVLSKTGTRRMIMGHTPTFTNIVSRCNGKVIIIDTGISHAYGGVLSALSIHYTFNPIPDDDSFVVEGQTEQLLHDNTGRRWKEREVVSALYADHQEVLVDEERDVVGTFDVY